MAKNRTPDQIRADIAAARKAMAANVEGLVSEVHPTALKDRAVHEAKTAVSDTVNDAKSAVTNTVKDAKSAVMDTDGPRWDRIGTAALVAGAVIIVFGLIKVIGRVL